MRGIPGFDEAFQEKIVRLMYLDDGFCEAAIQHMKPDLFDNRVHKWVVGKMQWSLSTLGSPITPTILKQEWKKAVEFKIIKPEERAAFKRFLGSRIAKPVPDRSYIKSEVNRFAKHQAYRDFTLWMAEDGLPKQRFEDIEKRLGNLMDIDVTGDHSIGTFVGRSYKKRIARREQAQQDGIPTPSNELNRILTPEGLPPKHMGVVIAPTGRGKCLGKGTPVLRYDGTVVPVELVRVGDLLMGPDSRPRRVLSLSRGRSDLFEVIPAKGDPWVCNDVHVLTLVHTESGEIVDVPLNEYQQKSKWWKHCHKQFGVGVEFPANNKPLLVSPYFLGVWLGDGSKRTDVARVSKPDPEVRAACVDEAARWGLTVSAGVRNPLGQALATLVGEGLHIPREYLVGSREDRLDFLAGWLDTDGSLHYGGFNFSQKRLDYVEGVAFLARSLGFKVVRRKDKVVNGERYYRIGISGDCSVIPLRIPRKRAAVRQQSKDALRTGFKVRSLGEGDYFGFTLDGDGRFLLGDFTVTHNTNWLIDCAATAVLDGKKVAYYTLELEEAVISDRFDAWFSDVPLKALKNNSEDVAKAWRKIASKVADNLIVKEYPTGQMTLGMLKAHLQQLARYAFYPDLIVIDYVDLMKPRVEFSDSSYETQGQLYIDVRGFAGKEKVALWTGTQGNRKSMEQEEGDVDLAHAADSVKKVFVADLVMGLAQSKKEQQENLMRLGVLKNRLGPAGREIPITVDHGVCKFRDRS